MSVAIEVWGYALTWLEIVAFVFTLACVYLNTREHVAAWPIGIVGTGLYAVLFFESKLYGDFGLQFVYIASSVYGWYAWSRGGANDERLAVSRVPKKTALFAGGFVIFAWPLAGLFFDRCTDTDVPYFDALPTVLSLCGQWMLARKHIENWWLWIVADVIYVVLFIYKHLYLTSLLYALFIGLCALGLRDWNRSLRKSQG